jgi:CBS-domain-containing membrane protein
MTQENIERVRIYVSEQDLWETRPLYLVLLEHLQREGASGATALRGMVGFGTGQGALSAGLGLKDSPPVVVEWIDRIDRVARILPLIKELVPNALITQEHIQVYSAVLRAHGPFAGERNVGDIMDTAPQTLPLASTLDRVVAAMLETKQKTLPIVDAEQNLLGVVMEHEIMQRAGLRLPLHLLHLLNEEEISEVLSQLARQPTSEIMNGEPHSVYEGTAIPNALVTMIEWSYDQIPVTNRQGKFAGLLDADAVLSMVVEQNVASSEQVRDAQPSTPVQLVMQAVVPHADLSKPLPGALQQMLNTSSRYLVVVDDQKHVRGSLNDADVLQYLSGAERVSWITALQSPTPPPLAAVPGMGRSVADAMNRSVSTLPPTISIIEAVRRLLELNVDRVPVADESGKLLGLLARGGLLRALLQESR